MSAHPRQSRDLEPQQASRQSDGPDLLTQRQVAARLGISSETWRVWRKAGRVPEPVTLPSGRLKWRERDIALLTREEREPVTSGRQFFRHARQSAPLRLAAKGGAR